MSGSYYCSCLLAARHISPCTKAWGIGKEYVYVCATWPFLCARVVLMHAPVRVHFSLVSTQCAVVHVYLCVASIGVCVSQLGAMCELSVKIAVLLPSCY